jgi:hypothetical protein
VTDYGLDKWLPTLGRSVRIIQEDSGGHQRLNVQKEGTFCNEVGRAVI